MLKRYPVKVRTPEGEKNIFSRVSDKSEVCSCMEKGS